MISCPSVWKVFLWIPSCCTCAWGEPRGTCNPLLTHRHHLFPGCGPARLSAVFVSAFLPVNYLDSRRGFLLCYRSATKLWCHQADDSFGVAWAKTFHPEATALVKAIISLTVSFFPTCTFYSSFGIVDVIVGGKDKS